MRVTVWVEGKACLKAGVVERVWYPGVLETRTRMTGQWELTWGDSRWMLTRKQGVGNSSVPGAYVFRILILGWEWIQGMKEEVGHFGRSISVPVGSNVAAHEAAAHLTALRMEVELNAG